MATYQEIAHRLWPELVAAADNRQVPTYQMLAKRLGQANQGIGQALYRIEAYCIEKKLPPLTLIVVLKESGMPGSGFSALKIVSAEDLARGLKAVFDMDWPEAPSSEELAAAYERVGRPALKR